MMMLRCVQVLRRLMVRNKDVGVFCNVSAATLGNPANFAQCLDFLDAKPRAGTLLRARIQTGDVPQSRSRRERQSRGAGAARLSPFPIDHVTDLRIEPRSLPTAASASSRSRPRCCSIRSRARPPNPSSDLSDLLGRFGIDLIAERIEANARGGSARLRHPLRTGLLFAPPRPCAGRRHSGGSSAAPANAPPEALGPGKPIAVEPAAIDRHRGCPARRAGAPRRGPA